jgi:hypothetical protein
MWGKCTSHHQYKYPLMYSRTSREGWGCGGTFLYSYQNVQTSKVNELRYTHPRNRQGVVSLFIDVGEMPEWLIGTVSKTVIRLCRIQGSNPCLSAIYCPERENSPQCFEHWGTTTLDTIRWFFKWLNLETNQGLSVGVRDAF